MHADVIHVMIDGRVIESGSHKELLDQDGYLCTVLACADAGTVDADLPMEPFRVVIHEDLGSAVDKTTARG